MKNKFEIQESQYGFPYHHIVDFSPFNNYKVLGWGFEYYAYISKIFDILEQRNFTSLLDVGCGEGKMIFELSRRFPNKKFHGIDPSRRAILFAQAFNFGTGASFEVKDIKDEKGTYDIITLVETLEHIADEKIKEMISHVKRLLAPNGILIVTVPTINFPLIDKHYRHYDIDILKNQCDGLEIESVEYVVKFNSLYKVVRKLFGKFSAFSVARAFLFFVTEKYVIPADEHTGRHIVAVLRKK